MPRFHELPREELLRISAEGGRAAHAKGVAHTWSHITAKRAGMIGGRRKQEKRLEREEQERQARKAQRKSKSQKENPDAH